MNESAAICVGCLDISGMGSFPISISGDTMLKLREFSMMISLQFPRGKLSKLDVISPEFTMYSVIHYDHLGTGRRIA